MLLKIHFTYTLRHRSMYLGHLVWASEAWATFLHLSQAQNSTFLWMQFDREVGKQPKMLRYDTVPLLRESLQKIYITINICDLPFHLICYLSTWISLCYTSPSTTAVHYFHWHVCQTSGSHSLPPPEPELHTLLRAFSAPTPSTVMIVHIARTVILHHPACHIPCFLLSPHFYHPSVPSGIRSFYQWSGASASSGVRSRSQWEGWCWKDSA